MNKVSMSGHVMNVLFEEDDKGQMVTRFILRTTPDEDEKSVPVSCVARGNIAVLFAGMSMGDRKAYVEGELHEDRYIDSHGVERFAYEVEVHDFEDLIRSSDPDFHLTQADLLTLPPDVLNLNALLGEMNSQHGY